MIRYRFNNKEYDWLSDIRQDIWDTQRKVFGAWNDEMLKLFGIEEVVLPDPVATPYKPTEEELAQRVRDERDRKIEETDYFVMPDYPSDPNELERVKVYRQSLRDITKQETFPNSVEWPMIPKVFCKETH